MSQRPVSLALSQPGVQAQRNSKGKLAPVAGAQSRRATQLPVGQKGEDATGPPQGPGVNLLCVRVNVGVALRAGAGRAGGLGVWGTGGTQGRISASPCHLEFHIYFC